MKKLCFFSLLAFAACKKTDDRPMGASKGGQSYLSCKINGKPYTFTGKPVGLNPDGVTYQYVKWERVAGVITRDFSIDANALGNLNAQIHLRLSADTTYQFPLDRQMFFSEVTGRDAYVLLRSSVDFGNSYYYADGNGWINISRADSIGTGTFGFTAFGLDNNGNRVPGSDSIIVTDGKFDIRD